MEFARAGLGGWDIVGVMKPRPAPTMSGDLGSTSVASLFWSFRERDISGTLALHGECHADVSAGETLCTFERGALTQVRQPQPLDTLGCVLREQGAITGEQFDESLARMAAREGLQGAILVAMGACTEEAVARALRAQLRRKALRLFALDKGHMEFFRGVDLLTGFGGERRPEDVLPLLWPGFRSYPDHAAVAASLARLGSRSLRLLPDADLAGFGFSGPEVKVIEALRAGPASLTSLTEAAGPTVSVRLLVALLLTTGLAEPAAHGPVRVASGVQPVLPLAPPSLRERPTDPGRRISSTNLPVMRDVGGRPAVIPQTPVRPSASSVPRVSAPVRPSASTLPAVPPPPPKPPVDVRARLATAEARLVTMLDETYFQMLGVDADAPAAEARAAHAERMEAWRPGAAPEGAIALRDVLLQITTLLDEALAALVDDEARRRHVEEITTGVGTPNGRRGRAVQLDAQSRLHAAEVCLRSGAHDGAIKAAREALAVRPEMHGAIAVLVAAMLAKDPSGPCIEALGWVARGLKLDPNDDRMHVLAGQVHARRGDGERATEHFAQAYRINSTNMDAVRELRAIAARRRGRGGESSGSGGGMLSRLFGR